tara:strand:+ start:18029 stop:20710 length:2682 start_codon:yes stop_codon:yes gene_type:complete
MTQNRHFKDQLLIVDEKQVGNKDRGTVPPNTSKVRGERIDFHPMVRDNWGTEDPLRGLMASYYTVYNSSKGPALYNYSGSLRYIAEGGDITKGALDRGPDSIGRLNKQVAGASGKTNIILTPIWNGSDDSVRLARTLAAKNAWESYGSSPANSYEAAPYSWYRDNFEEYINGGVIIEDNASALKPEYNGLMNNAVGSSYFDHTSNYFLFSSNKNTRQESGITTTVEPVYNYYVNSNPDYEEVISNPKIKEYLIPNAYYLQLELQNTSSQFLANYHRTAITMGEKIPWFIQSILPSALENNNGVYYNLYSDNMNQAIESLDVNIENQIKDANGDIAVLYSDLAVLNEDSIIDESLPFYNKITIGQDADRTTGEDVGNLSLIQKLLEDDDTRDFVDILQAYAINKYRERPGTRTFKARQKAITNSTSGDFTFNTTDKNYDLLFGFDAPMFVTDMSQVSDFIPIPSQVLDETQSVKYLRDYFGKSKDELELDLASALEADLLLFDSNRRPTELLKAFKRTLKQVFENRSCETETLMYIIEKHKGEPLEEEGSLVQTFFVSPKYFPSFPADTTYYDTQIKYNQKYTYVFKKIVLVFGNEYKYFAPGFTYNAAGTVATGFNLDYENSLSIKALVVPYSFKGLEIAVIDKPPVSPNVSFYPVKGSNSRIKILLNSSTGDYFDKPVRILDSDQQLIQDEYFGQTGESLTYDQIKADDKKIRYKSDDPVDKYQLFRINSKPTSYRDFNDNFVEVDPDVGIPGYYEDSVSTNRKYYYCARSVDVHGNISNPTYIFELEMVDNNGQIYLRQNVFTFKQSKPTYLKDGRRFIYIEPSFQQVALEKDVDPPSDIDNDPPSESILGVNGVDKVWTQSYKVRVTSKKTGKKLDLNLTFKNTGVTNPS